MAVAALRRPRKTSTHNRSSGSTEPLIQGISKAYPVSVLTPSLADSALAFTDPGGARFSLSSSPAFTSQKRKRGFVRGFRPSSWISPLSLDSNLGAGVSPLRSFTIPGPNSTEALVTWAVTGPCGAMAMSGMTEITSNTARRMETPSSIATLKGTEVPCPTQKRRL